MAEQQQRQTQSFTRPQQGPFTLALYRQVLEQVIEGKVFTLTVSTGDEERVFFFTRGAILFLAVGAAGGEVLARKILAKGLLSKPRLDELVRRANSGTPLLQDIIREEGILDAKVVASLAEETIEDHLLELMLWDGSLALLDLVPGNPPTKLYDPSVPAVRLSLGAKALLERVLAQREDALKILGPIGGVLRNRVRLLEGTTVPDPVIANHLATVPRAINEVILAAQIDGVPPWRTAQVVSQLVGQRKLGLDKVQERTKQEEFAQAHKIEDAFEGFVNALLARTHLATIYEKVQENEKAAEQYRGIADEHLKRDAIEPGVAALKNVVRLTPDDLSARELIVKVLRGADRIAEASKECLELARCFLDKALPGRARQAFELALKLVPKNLPVMWMLAGLLARLGEKEDAIKRYQEIAAMAREAGDRDAEVAAYQQVLELDPRHGEAKDVVHKLSGYKDAFRRRLLAMGGSVAFFLLVIAYGAYEMSALRAYEHTRDQARGAVDEQQFDVARSAVEEFKRGWSFTRLRGAADTLLVSIGDEEKLVKTQRSLREERQARDLEQKDQIPKALDLWKAAAADADEGERKQTLQISLAACDAKLKKVQDDLVQARELETQGLTKQAYDLIAQDVPHAPWLLEQKDLRVPQLIDSIPKEAQIALDGQVQEKATPLVVRRPLAPLRVRVIGRNRDPIEREVVGLQPWPLVFTLPRKAIWRAGDAVASSAPLLLSDLVLVGGVDRAVTAFARDSGALRWRADLGIFGECDAPLAAIGPGLLVARARSGTLYGISSAGSIHWHHDLERPELDPLDPHPERPVSTPLGALAREGSRGLVLVAPDGKVVWKKRASSDMVGVPAVLGDTLLVAGERTLLALKTQTGEPSWRLDLPASPVLGPVVGPKNTIFVALEQGVVARVSPQGKLLGLVRDLFEGSVSAAFFGEARWVLVGSQVGDLVALDEEGKILFRSFNEQQRPVLWARSGGQAILFGDASMLYVMDREGRELWRHPVENAGPAVADEQHVYQGAPDGLSAYDR